jgi:hypothetical protein
MKRTIQGKINIGKTTFTQLTNVKQLDSITLVLDIYNNNVPLNITGQTISLYAKRSNKTTVEQLDGITKDTTKVTIAVKNSCFAIPGITEMELRLVDSIGSISTSTFYITVDESLSGKESVNANNEIAILDEAKEKEPIRQRNEDIRKSNEDTRQTNEIERIKAEEIRKQNETARETCYEEIKDSRVDFDGGIHKNLNLRLLEDFNNLYKLIYNSTLIPYEGQYITANNSCKGMTEDLQIKGRTLQNLLKLVRTDIIVKYGSVAIWELYKPNTIYTIKVTNKTTETKQFYINETCFTSPTEFTVQAAQTSIIKATTLSSFTSSQSAVEILLKNKITHTQPNDLGIVILEGDWTNKEIPSYFTGIRSVGESNENLDLVTCGKNILKGLVEDREYTAIGTTNSTNFLTDYIKVVPSKSYTLSAFIKDTIPFTDTTGNATLRVDIYDINKYLIINQGIKGNVTTEFSRLVSDKITLPNNAKYIRINFRHANGGTGTAKNIQLEYDQLTDYQQYKEHRQAINVIDTLKGINDNLCDVIDFNSSKLTRNIGRVALNGSEDWGISDDTLSNTIRFSVTIPNALTSYSLISNFTSLGTTTFQNDYENMQVASVSKLHVRILRTRLATQDVVGLKAWLKVNPITVYYQLATPVETQMDDLILPRTYEPITYLFTEGSLIESILKCKIPSSIPAKIQTLSLQNQALQAENIAFRNTLEENSLTSIENSVNQESKITVMELGVI